MPAVTVLSNRGVAVASEVLGWSFATSATRDVAAARPRDRGGSPHPTRRASGRGEEEAAARGRPRRGSRSSRPACGRRRTRRSHRPAALTPGPAACCTARPAGRSSPDAERRAVMHGGADTACTEDAHDDIPCPACRRGRGEGGPPRPAGRRRRQRRTPAHRPPRRLADEAEPELGGVGPTARDVVSSCPFGAPSDQLDQGNGESGAGKHESGHADRQAGFQRGKTGLEVAFGDDIVSEGIAYGVGDRLGFTLAESGLGKRLDGRVSVERGSYSWRKLQGHDYCSRRPDLHAAATLPHSFKPASTEPGPGTRGRTPGAGSTMRLSTGVRSQCRHHPA